MAAFVNFCSVSVAVVLAALSPSAASGQAPGQPGAPTLKVDVTDARYAGEIVIPAHKSRILTFDRPFSNVMVGDPKIADVLALSDRTLHVLGKERGSTSLAVYGPNRALLAVMDLTVSHDVEGLKRRLFEVMGTERIEVRPANGSVVLSGTLSSTEQVTRAMSIAERFAPGNVSNLLRVEGSQQVMVAVRFAEMKRTAAKQLGLTTKATIPVGNVLFKVLSGSGASLSSFGKLGITASTGDVTIDALLDALEQNRVLKTLAEPNLIALSGETASFLAGGEFPVPVAQSQVGGAATVTVEFKEFGVRLSFTPTVVGDGVINMSVEPEVSAIDTTTSVTLSGFNIPGLTTRRAKTSVDLKDGQSFAIAGLIQSDFQDSIRRLPGLGDLPVLGTLFRSAEFQRSETELVIIVTPHLVKPARAGDLVLPTDTFVPPSEMDFFLRGKPEPDGSSVPGQSSRSAGGRAARGGLDGTVGHIVR